MSVELIALPAALNGDKVTPVVTPGMPCEATVTTPVALVTMDATYFEAEPDDSQPHWFAAGRLVAD